MNHLNGRCRVNIVVMSFTTLTSINYFRKRPNSRKVRLKTGRAFHKSHSHRKLCTALRTFNELTRHADGIMRNEIIYISRIRITGIDE